MRPGYEAKSACYYTKCQQNSNRRSEAVKVEISSAESSLVSRPCARSSLAVRIAQQWRSQDEQVTWAQHGHTQCVRNMHLLGHLGHTPAMKIIHSEIASEAVFGHKYNSFSLTCMLASCPHETCDRTCY